jgi:hypothetical protein
MINLIRKIICDHPFWYRFYYNLQVKNKHKGKKQHSVVSLNSEVDYYLDGYERSGNTYAKFLFMNFFPTKKGLSHLHRIAPLKIYLNKKVICFILFREPLESIASNYLKEYSKTALPKEINKEVLKKRTNDWERYYEFCSKNKSKIILIDFNKLTKDTENCLLIVSENFVGSNKIDSRLLLKLNQDFKNHNASKKDVLGSSMPNETKDREKIILKDYLQNSGMAERAKEIYKELLS